MSETVRRYFKTTFEKKKVITKAIILAIAFVLVLIPSISFYYWLRDKTGTPFGTNKFWYIQVEWNSGVAFSALNDKPGAIYAIQAIVFIILMAAFWLLVQDRISGSFIACAIGGGLFNLIQRAAEKGEHVHKVLDYFRFGFWENFAVFNWPDMFVVVGIFGFVVAYIVYIVRSSRKEDEQQIPQQPKIEANQEQPKPAEAKPEQQATPAVGA